MMTQFGKHLVTSVVIRLNPGDFLIEYFLYSTFNVIERKVFNR